MESDGDFRITEEAIQKEDDRNIQGGKKLNSMEGLSSTKSVGDKTEDAKETKDDEDDKDAEVNLNNEACETSIEARRYDTEKPLEDPVIENTSIRDDRSKNGTIGVEKAKEDALPPVTDQETASKEQTPEKENDNNNCNSVEAASQDDQSAIEAQPKDDSDASESGDCIQFRCKLCQFTYKDKDEIANHFLSKHIAVEVRSSKAQSSSSSRSKRGRKPKQAQKPKQENKDKEELQEERVVINFPREVSVSRSGRIRRRPFKFAVDSDDAGSLPTERDDSPEEKKTKRRGGSRSRREKEEIDNTLNYKEFDVSPQEFNKLLEEKILNWEKNWFLLKSTTDIKCQHPGCNTQLDAGEIDLHAQCHRDHLVGFQCPQCCFMCVHWRNMRHHYHKEHGRQRTKTLNCNQAGCKWMFERFGDLRRHVLANHVRPALIVAHSKDPWTIQYRVAYSKVSDDVEQGGVMYTVKEVSSVASKSLVLDAGSKQDISEEAIVDKSDEVQPNIQKDGEEESAIILLGKDESEDFKEHDNSTNIHESSDTKMNDQSEPLTKDVVSTIKRITKKRKLWFSESQEETKPKRQYRKSKEFIDSFEKQRALVAYCCDVCLGKFNSIEDMTQHRELHEDEDPSKSKCSECTVVFSGQDTLQKHVKEQHKRLLKLHRCHLCNFSSDRRFDLKKHLVIHTGAKNYMCDQCGKCMSTPYNLKIHYMRLHATDQEKTISCTQEDCDFKCADKAVLKDHLRQRHNLYLDHANSNKIEPLKVYQCEHCPYVGKKESSLRYHMRIHLENRQHKCKLCPYASKTKNNLILHMRTHDGLQPLKCPQCDFKGATNKIISEHILSKHAGIRPYKCTICQWSTAYSGNMWKHVHEHKKELADKMPDHPVEIITAEGVSIPVPLKPPSGKKRLSYISAYPTREPSATEDLKALSRQLEAARSAQKINQMNALDSYGNQTLTIVELDGHEQGMILSSNDATSSSALKSLAVAVASAKDGAVTTPADAGQDVSSSYPLTHLFQQIAAGQAAAEAANLQQIIPGVSYQTTPGVTGAGQEQVIITVDSESNLHESIMQSGLVVSSGDVGECAPVTMAYSIPTTSVGPGQIAVQYTSPQGIPLDPPVFSTMQNSSTNGDQIALTSGTLPVLQRNTGTTVTSDSQSLSADDQHQLVTMIPETGLVMSMVQGDMNNQGAKEGQSVESHVIIAGSENPEEYVQHEVQYMEGHHPDILLEERSETTHILHLIRRKNGELAYRDKDGTLVTYSDVPEGAVVLLEDEEDTSEMDFGQEVSAEEQDGQMVEQTQVVEWDINSSKHPENSEDGAVQILSEVNPSIDAGQVQLIVSPPPDDESETIPSSCQEEGPADAHVTILEVPVENA